MSKALITESTLTAIADAIRAKAGTTAAMKPGEMAAAIAAIPKGSGSKYGVDVTPFFGEVDSSGKLSQPTEAVDLTISGFTSIASYVFSHKFYRCSGLRSVTFADLESVPAFGMNYCFQGCTRLTHVSFPALEEVKGDEPFYYAFQGCTALESAEFPVLRQIGENSKAVYDRQFNYAFQSCNKLTELHFPALELIYCNGTNAAYGTFSYSNKLQKIYLPACRYIGKGDAYTNVNAANGTFSHCDTLTEIHFAAAHQAEIESSTGYAKKWGATKATISFDL